MRDFSLPFCILVQLHGNGPVRNPQGITENTETATNGLENNSNNAAEDHESSTALYEVRPVLHIFVMRLLKLVPK